MIWALAILATSPADFVGSDWERMKAASLAARDGDGIVELDRIYVVSRPVSAWSGVTYRGGGLRRECSAEVATVAEPLGQCVETTGELPIGRVQFFDGETWLGKAFIIDAGDGWACAHYKHTIPELPIGSRIVAHDHMMMAHNVGGEYQSGIVIDSMEFDGNADCSWCPDWHCGASLSLRGKNEIRGSWFHDVPAENIYACGAVISGNVASSLAGSFVHISCGERFSGEPEVITGNVVAGARRIAAELGHAQAIVTLSANSRWVVLTANRWLLTPGPVVGNIGADDGPIVEVP